MKGNGISCPQGCSQSYVEGAVVRLVATAARGSVFAGWSGECHGSGGCRVTLLADRDVAARFAAKPRRVAVQAPPSLPARAHVLGAVAPSMKLTLQVVLPVEFEAALQEFIDNVSTPGSPSFRHFLPAGAFAERFGPPRSWINSVEGFLRSHQLTVRSLSRDHLAITVTGTAGAVERAFDVRLDAVELPGEGKVFANRQAPSVPDGIARHILGIVGLDDLPFGRPAGLASGPSGGSRTRPVPRAHQAGLRPCAAAASGGGATPDELADAYDFNAFYGAGDSGGTTVALYEEANFNPKDIATYQACYGTSVPVLIKSTPLTGVLSNQTTEVTSDIEDVIGLAPADRIIVYEADDDPLSAFVEWRAIVNDDLAPIVSTSWSTTSVGFCSLPPFIYQIENQVFQEAASQGQTVFSSSGDNGSEACGGTALHVLDPGSQPLVTAVGGTEWPSGSVGSETTWNAGPGTPAGTGSTGGESAQWLTPEWQIGPGVVEPDLAGQCHLSGGCREVPDISALAGSPGYSIFCTTSDCKTNGVVGWGSIDGTSLAAPLWAAMASLEATATPGGRLGFLNPQLYIDAAAGVGFKDITTGNNDVQNANHGTYPAGPGYDMATGLGTPNGRGQCQIAGLKPCQPPLPGQAGSPPLTVITFVITTGGACGSGRWIQAAIATVAPRDVPWVCRTRNVCGVCR